MSKPSSAASHPETLFRAPAARAGALSVALAATCILPIAALASSGGPVTESTLVPSAAAAFARARVPSPEELRASGWTPSSGRSSSPEIAQPLTPIQRGVRLLVSQPEALPRPSVLLGGKPIALPLAARHELVERQETAEGPVLAWTPRFQVRTTAASVLVLGVDARPYAFPMAPDQSDVQSAFKLGERRLAAAPLGITAQLAVDPARRFRLEKPPEQADDSEVPSGASLRPLASPAEGDAVLVTLDGGQSWWEAILGAGPDASDRHHLDATRVFVDGGRVYLAPLAKAPDAARELLFIDLPETEVRALPFPTPREADWRCEISDLRRGVAGLEAIVLVHDPRLRRGPEVGAAASWAARLRWSGGSWQELERIPLPGDARALRLRSEAEGQDLLLFHGEELLGLRPLSAS